MKIGQGFCPYCGKYISLSDRTVCFVCSGCDKFVRVSELLNTSISGQVIPNKSPSLPIMGQFYKETPEGIFESKYAKRRKLAKEI